MVLRKAILLSLAFSSALFAYLSLEKLTGGNPAFFNAVPKPFVPPPPQMQKYQSPDAPVLPPSGQPPAVHSPVDDWTRLPPMPPH